MNRPRSGSFHLRVVALLATVLIVLGVLAAPEVPLLVFAALLVAIFLRTVARGPERWLHLGPRVSLVACLLVMLVLVVGGGWLLAPSISDQAGELREQLPAAWDRLQERFSGTGIGNAAGRLADESRQWIPEASTLMQRAAGLFSTLAGGLSALVIVFAVAVCLALEPETYAGGLVALFPLARRKRAYEVLGQIERTLRSWLFAKLLSMTLIGVLTLVGLWLLGIPLAIVLALIAALLTFIPNIGPIMSAVPPILLGFVESPWKALGVAGMYFGIQMVESYLVTPLIERETVSLPPAITIAAQLLLGLLAGILGVIVATPLTAMLIVLVQTVYIQDVLGDRSQQTLMEQAGR